MKTPTVAASVRQRLLTLAQARNWEFNRVLARYGVERVLCRLAASSHGERFRLKGSMLKLQRPDYASADRSLMAGSARLRPVHFRCRRRRGSSRTVEAATEGALRFGLHRL